MIQRRLIHATFTIGASAAGLILFAAPAAEAKESKRAICTAALGAYKTGAAHEKAGRLQEARDAFQSCAQVTACGGLFPKCQAKYDQLVSQGSTTAPQTASEPAPHVAAQAAPHPAARVGPEACTVVPIVIDETGTPQIDVQVRVDGQLLAQKIDGKALPVAVGVHEFTFATERGVFATQKVVIAEGERNRKIEVAMGGPAAKATRTAPVAAAAEESKVAPENSSAEAHSPEAPAAATPREERARGGSWALPRSPIPYLIGTVGLAGAAGGALLTYWGNKDNDQAVAQCNHLCPPSTVDHIRTMYLAANISFGVGVVGLGVATWLFASSRSVEDSSHAMKDKPQRAAIFDVQPIRSGAFASMSGSF
jgi:hypothetical protein